MFMQHSTTTKTQMELTHLRSLRSPHLRAHLQKKTPPHRSEKSMLTTTLVDIDIPVSGDAQTQSEWDEARSIESRGGK